MGRTKPRRAAAVGFGARVRSERERRKWSQMELAERSGLHFTYVSDVELGKRNVTLDVIVRFGDALDVDPGVFVLGLRPGLYESDHGPNSDVETRAVGRRRGRKT